LQFVLGFYIRSLPHFWFICMLLSNLGYCCATGCCIGLDNSCSVRNSLVSRWTLLLNIGFRSNFQRFGVILNFCCLSVNNCTFATALCRPQAPGKALNVTTVCIHALTFFCPRCRPLYRAALCSLFQVHVTDGGREYSTLFVPPPSTCRSETDYDTFSRSAFIHANCVLNILCGRMPLSYTDSSAYERLFAGIIFKFWLSQKATENTEFLLSYLLVFFIAQLDKCFTSRLG